MALKTNLVSYWNLVTNSTDQADGNTGTDTSMSYSANSGVFNGTTSAVAIADATNLHLQNNLTFAIWFNTTTDYTGFQSGLIAKDSITGTRNIWRIDIGNSPGQILFSTYNGTTFTSVTSSSNYNDGVWHLAVATLTSAYLMTLYIDNVSVGTPVTGQTLTTFPNGEMDFGALPAFTGGPRSGWYTGSLRRAGVWSTVLSASDMTILYNGGLGLNYPFNTGNFLSFM